MSSNNGEQGWFLRELHWIGLFAEVFIFCCTFSLWCGKPGHGAVMAAVLAFVAIIPTYSQGEQYWNVLLATASVVCLLQVTMFVYWNMQIKNKSGPRTWCFTFVFNAAALAVVAAVASATILLNPRIVWSVTIIASWLILLLQVIVVNRFVWMIAFSGPLQYDPIERQQTFAAAITLTTILFTVVPCLNAEPFDFMYPVMYLVGAVFTRVGALPKSKERESNEEVIVSSGSFNQSNGQASNFALAWAPLISFPPFILLIYASFQFANESQTLGTIQFVASIVLYGLALSCSKFVSAGPLRWSVVTVKQGTGDKEDGLLHDAIVVVEVETVTMLHEYQVVRSYQGTIPEQKKQPRFADDGKPIVYHLSDLEAPRVVLETSNNMVEMTPEDPIGFHQAVEKALAQVGHKSESGAGDVNQEGVASGTAAPEIL